MSLHRLQQMAQRVMAKLGKGQKECIYARALNLEMNAAGIGHRYEVDVPIMYNQQCVGHGRADLIMGNIVIEVKAVKAEPRDAADQVARYVENLTMVEHKDFVGVVINFCQTTGRARVYTLDDDLSLIERKAIVSKPPVVRSRFFTRSHNKSF